MQGAQDAVTGGAGALSGQIRIGAPDGCANFLLPQVCAEISDANPDLEFQIVALPRVVNLSKREADMAVAVSPPQTGRLSVQKISDYNLHLAASQGYLDRTGPIKTEEALNGRRLIGYIPDMIFDKELDYLEDFGLRRVALASNSVSVQFHWVRLGAGLGIVHRFAIPTAPDVRPVLADKIMLKRSFYLIRHADDRRLERMNRLATALADGVRREVARLEALT
jgi:DNA-binding transcriptional LysR family regulator